MKNIEDIYNWLGRDVDRLNKYMKRTKVEVYFKSGMLNHHSKGWSVHNLREKNEVTIVGGRKEEFFLVEARKVDDLLVVVIEKKRQFETDYFMRIEYFVGEGGLEKYEQFDVVNGKVVR